MTPMPVKNKLPALGDEIKANNNKIMRSPYTILWNSIKTEDTLQTPQHKKDQQDEDKSSISQGFNDT